jgi:hypothetical protein
MEPHLLHRNCFLRRSLSGFRLPVNHGVICRINFFSIATKNIQI